MGEEVEEQSKGKTMVYQSQLPMQMSLTSLCFCKQVSVYFTQVVIRSLIQWQFLLSSCIWGGHRDPRTQECASSVTSCYSQVQALRWLQRTTSSLPLTEIKGHDQESRNGKGLRSMPESCLILFSPQSSVAPGVRFTGN